MNTDKLMELERKWRDEPTLAKWAPGLKRAADELAAALRAEQAVGEDGRLPCPLGDACVGRDCNRCGNFTPGTARQSKFGVVPPPNPAAMVKAAYKAEAMRTARQSEGVVLVPKRPTEAMLKAGRDAVMARDCSSSEWGPADHYEAAGISRKGMPDHLFEGKGKMSKSWGAELVYAAMLAAAPGGEGEK